MFLKKIRYSITNSFNFERSPADTKHPTVAYLYFIILYRQIGLHEKETDYTDYCTVHDKEDQDQTHVVRKRLYKRKIMMINETNIGKADIADNDKHFIYTV